MKHVCTLLILIVTACGSSKYSSSTTPPELGPGKNTIQLKINEEKTIQVPTSASNSAQMGFTLSDASIATISRKEVVSTYDSSGLRPGDPVLVNWVIKGLKSGTTRAKFSGGRPPRDNSANIRLKNF